MFRYIMANPTDEKVKQDLIEAGIAVASPTSLADILINALLEQGLIEEVITGLPETSYSLVAGNHVASALNYDTFNVTLSKLKPSAIIENEKGFRYILLGTRNGNYEFGTISEIYKDTFEETLNNLLQASNHSDERIIGLDPGGSFELDSDILDAAFSEGLTEELSQDLQGEPTMTDDRKYEIDAFANLPDSLTPATFGPNIEAMVSLPGQDGFHRISYSQIPLGTDFQIKGLDGYFKLTDNQETITIGRPKPTDTKDDVEVVKLEEVIADTTSPRALPPPLPSLPPEQTQEQKELEQLKESYLTLKATLNGLFEGQTELEERLKEAEGGLGVVAKKVVDIDPRSTFVSVSKRLRTLDTIVAAINPNSHNPEFKKLKSEVSTLRSLVDDANQENVSVFTQFEEGGNTSNVVRYSDINTSNTQKIPSLKDAPRNSFVEVINPITNERSLYKVLHDGTQEELSSEKIEQLIEKETKDERARLKLEHTKGLISKGTHYSRLAATTAALIGTLAAAAFGLYEGHQQSKEQGAKEQVEKFVEMPAPREIITNDGINSIIEVNGKLKYDLNGDGIFTNAPPGFEIDAQGINVALNNAEARLENLIAGQENLGDALSQTNEALGQSENYQAKLTTGLATTNRELATNESASKKLDQQLKALQQQRVELALSQTAQKEQLRELETAITTQRKELAANRRDLSKAQKEQAAARKSHVRIKAQIPKTTQTSRELHKEAGALERRVVRADTRVEEGQSKLASLEKKYQAGQTRVKAFRETVATAGQELDAMQGSIRTRNNEVTRLTAQSDANTKNVSKMYAAAKPLLEDLEARTSTLTPRVETVLATAKQAQANISAAQATYKKIKKPIAQLTPQAKQAREDTSKALDQLVQAQADLNTAQSTYKATKGPIVKISKKAASAKAAATKARTNLDAAQATYQTIQEPLTKIAPLAAQARADANQALQDVTRATTNYNRALNNYNATSAKVGSLGTNTDKLSATIKALETSYNRLNQAYQRTLDLKKQTTGQFPGGLESHLKTLFTQLEQAKALQEQLTANQPKQYTLQDLETQVDEHIGGLDSSKFKQFKTKALYKLNPKGTLYAAKKQGQTYLIVRATSCEQATETLEPFLATITSEDVSKIVNDDCVNRYNGQTGKKTFNFF